MTSSSQPLQIGALISGGGRTLMNILACIERGELNAKVNVVISSLSQVKGVERARNAKLPVEIIRRKDHADVCEFSQAIDDTLAQNNVDLVVQAGYTCFWRIPDRLTNRVMNIHPALLPKYGGKGYFGHHVHEAVIQAGESVSGCTVHFANNEYDAGPIILQRTCPVLGDDTPDTLAERVFEQECFAYPEAIKLFAQNKLKVQGQQVVIQEA